MKPSRTLTTNDSPADKSQRRYQTRTYTVQWSTMPQSWWDRWDVRCPGGYVVYYLNGVTGYRVRLVSAYENQGGVAVLPHYGERSAMPSQCAQATPRSDEHLKSTPSVTRFSTPCSP